MNKLITIILFIVGFIAKGQTYTYQKEYLQWSGINGFFYDTTNNRLVTVNSSVYNASAYSPTQIVNTEAHSGETMRFEYHKKARSDRYIHFGIGRSQLTNVTDNDQQMAFSIQDYGTYWATYENGQQTNVQQLNSDQGDTGTYSIVITDHIVTYYIYGNLVKTATLTATGNYFPIVTGNNDNVGNMSITGAQISYWKQDQIVTPPPVTTVVKGSPINVNVNGRPITINPNGSPIVISVLVSTPFAILTQPNSQTVTQGGNVTFSSAFANGFTPYGYQWAVNGVNIFGATSSSYTISNLQTSNAGSYTVAATDNNQTAITSNAAVLTVTTVPAPTITTQPSSQTVASDGTATFSVSTSGGLAPLAYQWKANGTNISGATSSSYSKTVSTSDNNTSFSVVVTDANSHLATSSAAVLTVTPSSSSGTAFSFATTDMLNSTSAGVYNPDGTMVRNLWGNQFYTSGSHDTIWDGKDDNGNYLPNGNYRVVVQKNGIKKYQYANYRFGGWLGTVFNDADSISGGTKQHGTQLCGMEIMGHSIINFHTYLEGNTTADRTTTDHPRQKSGIGGLMGGTNFRTCNDGKTAYCLASTDYSHYYIFGVDSAGTFSNFANQQGTDQGRSLLAIVTGVASGIAAQKNGQQNFVFLALNDTIKVYDRTGNFIRNNTVSPTPHLLACDQTNGIWAGNKKYTVNSDGSLTGAGITVSGVIDLEQMAVSTDNTKISFVDGDSSSQQIKTYSNTTGALIWTLGQAGGYYHTANVSNDRFAFTVLFALDQTQTLPFIDYAPDGSFWINDCWSFRNMHFDANRNYIEKVAFLCPQYNTYMDRNNPSHVYAGYLRCTVDLTSDDPQHHWTLDKNFTQQIPTTVEGFEAFHIASTFSNGRSYAVLRNKNDVGSTASKIFDITDTLRNTGVAFDWQGIMDKDGNVATRPIYGANETHLTGFDGSNNPIYTNVGNYIGFNVPIVDSVPQEATTFSKLSDGSLVTIDPSTPNGYHVGIIPHNGTSFTSLNAPSTGTYYQGEYGLDGAYNNGNGTTRPAGTLTTANNVIYWNHHGEFWGSSGQTSYHQLVDQYGLPLWVDGTLQDAGHILGECAPWNSGNALHSQIAFYNGNYYLSYGDESRHGGVHIAKVHIDSTNLQYESHDLVKSSNTVPIYNYTDLLTGLPARDNLSAGTTGLWTVYGSPDNNFYAQMNLYTYGASRDVKVNFSSNVSGHQDSVSVALASIALNGWQVTGLSNWNNTANNVNYFHGSAWMDIQDNLGKVIARLEVIQNTQGDYQDHFFKINGVTVWSATSVDNYKLQQTSTPFNIQYTGGSLSYSQNGNTVTAPIFDNTANALRPTRIMFHSSAGANPDERIIDLVNLKLYQTQ